MAKKTQKARPFPKYPGSERFGDWDPDDMIEVDPSERVVPDKDSTDPNPLANVGGFGKKKDSSEK